MSNQATAVIVLDSVSAAGKRLTTFQLRYWRPIHSELMTHRVFSRNAGSSRARPSKAIIEQVRDNPWGPIHWGANQPGMQAHQELAGLDLYDAKNVWGSAAREAAACAETMVKIGAHKQIVNRLLEPFTYIDVLVTATDYANWFMLRDHADAQPEIRELAQLMKAAYDASVPDLICDGQWHLPYITPDDWDEATRYCQAGRITRDMPSYAEKLDILRKISVARCARVSYKAFDGTVAPIEKDLALFEQLLVSQPLHASPAEHQATPDSYRTQGDLEFPGTWRKPELHGNFTGWKQYRKMLPNEFLAG
jgi:hypothetical protein